MNMFKKMFRTMKNELEDTKVLLRNTPAFVMVLFVISVILMNLFANKEIYTGVSWLALDCGLLLSWLSFLSMDILTKRFGPKASIKLSVLALIVNLFAALIFLVLSKVPGNWAMFYDLGDVANTALNATFGGTWYVLLGSSIAFLVSAIVNALLNYSIGTFMKSDGFLAFATRSYISTLIGQFLDNLVFSLIVSHVFFGWSMIQCITCAFTGCIVELLCEVIFSPIGYRICKQWESEYVGAGYISFVNGRNCCKSEEK